MAQAQVYQGTLTEITSRYGKQLAGQRLRVTVDNAPTSADGTNKHFWETATTEQWIEALDTWAAGHTPSTHPLFDEAIDRDGIYEGRGE